jgi:cardiolipin synthase (CMP-forming)
LSEPILTVANQLTILRMALAPFLVVMVLQREFTWALVLFVVAAFTDLLDGYIARHGHQKTTLGAVMDPIADKILLSSSFIVLTWSAGLTTRIPQWLTVLALARDVLVLLTAALINLTSGWRIFQPSLLGKLSSAAQALTAGVVLVLNTLGSDFMAVRWLFRAVLALILASALHYLYLASTGKGLRSRAVEGGE